MTEEIKEKMREEKLSFKTVVFRQIERTNEAITKGQEPFDNAVNCLSALVYPKADKQFTKEMKAINKEIIETRRDPPPHFIVQSGWGNERKIRLEVWEEFILKMAFKRYQSVMSLLERKGLNDV